MTKLLRIHEEIVEASEEEAAEEVIEVVNREDMDNKINMDNSPMDVSKEVMEGNKIIPNSNPNTVGDMIPATMGSKIIHSSMVVTLAMQPNKEELNHLNKATIMQEANREDNKDTTDSSLTHKTPLILLPHHETHPLHPLLQTKAGRDSMDNIKLISQATIHVADVYRKSLYV